MPKHGDFIWYELLTNDSESAQKFYGKILDWKFNKAGFEGLDYQMFQAADAAIGGFLSLSEDMKSNGARPAWIGYLNVDSIEASLASIRKAGGEVLSEGSEITGVGPFALIADPQGALIYIIEDGSGMQSDAFTTEPKLGHCGWNELATTDQSASTTFYSEQFGWEQKDEMDMGPMGKYLFFHHGPMFAGSMTKPPEMPVSAWTYYFRVADIDVAAKAITDNGGTTLHEPQEVPGEDFVINAMDPEGVFFAVVGARSI